MNAELGGSAASSSYTHTFCTYRLRKSTPTIRIVLVEIEALVLPGERNSPWRPWKAIGH